MYPLVVHAMSSAYIYQYYTPFKGRNRLHLHKKIGLKDGARERAVVGKVVFERRSKKWSGSGGVKHLTELTFIF